MKNKIHLIGSNGFIGKNLVKNYPKNNFILWSSSKSKNTNYFDLLDEESWGELIKQMPQIVVFLSWPGLPNHDETFHVSRNLPACLKLFEILKNNGLKKIVVTGTCYEYGLLSGSVNEESKTDPINQYAIAKDTLRKSIFRMSKNSEIKICWLRIFYVYGEDKNKNSIYPSLINSISLGNTFNISSGRQIRDFVSIKIITKYIDLLINKKDIHGIFNGGSGDPISIIEFVYNIIKSRESNIKVNRYFYPDREDEPLAFWADMKKIRNILSNDNTKD